MYYFSVKKMYIRMYNTVFLLEVKNGIFN